MGPTIELERGVCDRTHTKPSFLEKVSDILMKPIICLISTAHLPPFSHSPTKSMNIKCCSSETICKADTNKPTLAFPLAAGEMPFPARNCKTQQQLLSDRAGAAASVALSAWCLPLSRCSAGNGAGAAHPFAGDSAEFWESFRDTAGGKPSPRWRCPGGPAWQKTLQTVCALWRPLFPPELSDWRERAKSDIVQVPPIK